MTIVANAVVILVALLHIYFLVLEMFLWDKPSGLKAFGQSKEKAEATKVLAANQGLYNGFLAAGLLLGVVLGRFRYLFQVVLFILCDCGRCLWGINCQPQNSIHPGPAGFYRFNFSNFILAVERRSP